MSNKINYSNVERRSDWKELIGLSPYLFLPQAFKVILGREPDKSGVIHYAGRLARHKNRLLTILEMLSSVEGKRFNEFGLPKELADQQKLYVNLKKIPIGEFRWLLLSGKWINEGDKTFDWLRWVSAYTGLNNENIKAEGAKMSDKKFKSPNVSGQLAFDEEFYIDTYPEVRDFEFTPWQHFVEIGANKDYNPNPLFNTGRYRSQYSNYLDLNIDPLTYFLNEGIGLGHSPSLIYDTEFVAINVSSVSMADRLSVYLSILSGGQLGSISPHPYFDSHYYKEQFEKIYHSSFPENTSAIMHYLKFDSGKGLIRIP